MNPSSLCNKGKTPDVIPITRKRMQFAKTFASAGRRIYDATGTPEQTLSFRLEFGKVIGRKRAEIILRLIEAGCSSCVHDVARHHQQRLRFVSHSPNSPESTQKSADALDTKWNAIAEEISKPEKPLKHIARELDKLRRDTRKLCDEAIEIQPEAEGSGTTLNRVPFVLFFGGPLFTLCFQLASYNTGLDRLPITPRQWRIMKLFRRLHKQCFFTRFEIDSPTNILAEPEGDLVQAEAQTCFNSLKQLVEEALAPELVQVATTIPSAVSRAVEIGEGGEKTESSAAGIAPGQSSPGSVLNVIVSITELGKDLLVEASRSDEGKTIKLTNSEGQSLLALYVLVGAKGSGAIKKRDWVELLFEGKDLEIAKLFQNRAGALKKTIGLQWRKTGTGIVFIVGPKFSEAVWNPPDVKKYLIARRLKC